MSEDEFTTLYIYMQKEFTKIHEKLDKKAGKDRVYSALDYIIKQLDTHDQERLFANHQMERHKSWIKQLAANTKTKLVPEP